MSLPFLCLYDVVWGDRGELSRPLLLSTPTIGPLPFWDWDGELATLALHHFSIYTLQIKHGFFGFMYSLIVDTRTITTMYVLWLHVQKSSLSELTKFGYKNKLWHRTVGCVVTRHCHSIKKYMRSLEKKFEANLSRTRPKRLVCTKQWGCTTGWSGTVNVTHNWVYA